MGMLIGSALQTLHRVSSRAREHNYFQGGLSHDWVSYYERRIESERSCLNEWHAMDNLESRRPPSPDSVRTKPRKRDETERVIRSTLKEIMMSVDLDEVTSKYIRGRLEEDLDMDLVEFKPFIDQEMLIILGQMDAPTEVFDHVYLGSEWNASNLEELQKNGVRHILNVTREIDNFFPGMFDYLNIRVYDDEKTDLLKHWDNTYKYITRARKEGSKVLVHCKMGVSRSASVVIAYAMKAYNWDFDKALNHVKEKRNCIKPNTSFISQLETYQGILDAMKNKEKLQRSKSETNLKSPGMTTKSEHRVLAGSEPTPLVQALGRHLLQTTLSGHDLSKMGSRPKSWSPDTTDTINRIINGVNAAPTSMSLEDINRENAAAAANLNTDTRNNVSGENQLQINATPGDAETEARNVLMPCEDGKIYSVSQNQIVHLPSNQDNESRVKNIVNELESQSSNNSDRKISQDRKGLVLNLANHFENAPIKSQEDEIEIVVDENPLVAESSSVKKETLEQREKEKIGDSDNSVSQSQCDSTINNSDSLVWTASSQLVVNNTSTNNDLSKTEESEECVNKDNEKIYSSKTVLGAISSRSTLPRTGDPFSAQLDRVFDREERKQQRNSAVIVPLPQAVTELSGEQGVRDSPSRQSSWSSFDSAVVLSFQGEARDTPSRHSSWGSGDTRVLPSRNSSWGSYDMRPMQNVVEKGEKQDDPLGSSGIFPYDRDDIPWHPGTVKRTKQKLEQGTASVKRICAENKSDSTDEIIVTPNLNLRVHCPRPYQSTSPTQMQSSFNDNRLVEAINTTLVEQRELDEYNQNRFEECAINNDIRINSVPLQYPRLSMSAPETSSMPLLGADCIKKNKSISASNISSLIRMPLRSFKTFSEATMNGGTRTVQAPKRCSSVEESSPKSPESDCSKNSLGLVHNLTMEFEAKGQSTPKDNKVSTSAELSVSDNDSKTKSKGRSLPSSPVSAHIEVQVQTDNETNTSDLEDLSVKVLVGKYEVSKNNTNIQKNKQRSIFDNKQQTNQQVNRKSMDVGCIQSQQPSLLIKHSTGYLPTFKNGSEKSIDNSDFRRPPVPPIKNNITMPNVVVANVVAKAERKKQTQHGKTQPMTRLAVSNTRHNNPMYNTM